MKENGHTCKPDCCVYCREFCKRFQGYKDPEPKEETPVPVKIIPTPRK